MPHTYLFEVVACPQWDRCSPIPIARDIPIASVGKPVTEAVVPNTLRYPELVDEYAYTRVSQELCIPSCLLVVCDKIVDDVCYTDEPCGDGTVDERSS